MNSVEGDEEEEEEENQLLLEPNCVQYRLYFDDIVSSNDDNCELEDADADAHHRSLLEQRKREIFECIFSNSMLHSSSSSSMMTTTRKIQNEKRIETYCWHRDGFNLEVHFCPDAKRWCLKGETKFQDAMDDEWMVVHVLTRAASERLYPNSCSMRIFDDDGEFLLVEASHLLPTWVEPNVAEGRTFVRGGAVRVVGDVSDFHNNNIDDDDGSEGNAQSRRTALKTNAEALDALIASCSFSSDEDREKKYSLGEAIDGYLKETKMKKYQTDEAILTSRHLARALLPRRVRNALRVISKEEEEERKRSDEMTTMTPTTKQTFIQTAARMFYERTPTDVRSSKEFRNLNLTEAVEDDAKRSVMDSVTLRFSRCAYAQLARAKFDAPRKYPMDVVAKTTDVDVHNAFDVGMKLVVGMEIALEKLLSEDVDEEEKASAFNAVEIAAILRFKDALDRAEETEHKDDDDNDSEFSDSLEPESDQWMRDGMLELDNEILARAAEREMHPLSEDDEDAFDDFGLDDDDILDERREKEKAFNEDVKRVGKKLGTFMNAKATYKGAEGVDDGNSRSSYSKKIAPPELDADAFERDLMNALMDDPESEQFLEQFTKDLVFNDESVVGASSSSMHASRKVADDVQNELDLQAEDFDVAYEAALREQLLGSHVEESVKRTTVTSMDPNGEEEGGTNVDERESIENETIKDVLKSAVMQNGQSGPASILLGTLEEKGSSSKE
jgi:succinate dehydrogenase flavin-adding protein (antitoxin of CptAB toxin-antitoxin module)